MNKLFTKSNTSNNGTSSQAPCFSASATANMLAMDTVIGVLFVFIRVIVNVVSIVRVLPVITAENKISKAFVTA